MCGGLSEEMPVNLETEGDASEEKQNILQAQNKTLLVCQEVSVSVHVISYICQNDSDKKTQQ